MAAIPEVTEQTFEHEVLRAELPVLVEFGATWCGPCKTVAPELEALARELEGKARVLQVDIDKSPLLAQTMGIRSVPTFVVFQKGRPVDGRQGAIRKAELRALLEPFLPRAAGAILPAEVAELARQGQITLVDTRAPEVFGRAHIEGAVNIPLETLEGRLIEIQTLPAPPVLYCRTGKETQELVARLAEQGLPLAYLEGGVLGWEAEGHRLARV